MKAMFKIGIALCLVWAAGCATAPQRVDPGNDPGISDCLDYKEIMASARMVINKISMQGHLDKVGGGRYTLAIGRVKLDLTCRLNPDTYTDAVAEVLMDNGKVIIRDQRRDDGSYDADMVLEGQIYEEKETVGGKPKVLYFLKLQLRDTATGNIIFKSGAQPIGGRQYGKGGGGIY